MTNIAITKPKGKLHCNSCHKAVPAKDGDWFEAAQSPGQQIFLCKPCESKHRSTHRRAGTRA